MAPEMAEGEPGSEASDVYALGVTMFRAFTREYPYGNADAMSPPRRTRPRDFSALRPDLPAWLAAVLTRAVTLDPSRRLRDMGEFAFEIETGPARARAPMPRPPTLYERAPVRVWQGIAALLALALIASLWWR
jgi:serine/threonine protein kinase